MRIIIKTLSLAFAILLFSCSGTRGNRDVNYVTETEPVENRQTVFSDDSLVVAYWWDTGNGGTAPDIEALCRFKRENGETAEEKRPLLRIVYPQYDYGHREVERIISIGTEYGRRIYFFYLRAKTDSNEYEHDLVAFRIDGDSLVPASVLCAGDKPVPHIRLNY